MKKFNSKLFFIKSAILHVVVSLIVAIIAVVFMEDTAYNFMHSRFAAKNNASDDIALIVIDDKSVEQYRWPWKRELYAKVFAYLSDYAHPKIVAYDALIRNPDLENPSSDAKFYSQIKKMDNLVVAFSPVVPEFSEDVNGKKYLEDFYSRYGVKVKDNRKSNFLFNTFKSISRSPKAYLDATRYVGSIQTPIDSYGYVNYANQIVNIGEHLYPSLGLRIYMKLNNIDSISYDEKYITAEGTNLKIPIKVTSIGIISRMRFYRIKKDTEYSHKKYSAVDLINSYDNIRAGKKPVIDPAEFKDKIVYVGGNAKSSTLALEDALPTPMLKTHPGVDIQATNLDNILHNDFMCQATLMQNVLIILLMTIITFVLIAKLSFFVSLISLLFMIVGYEMIVAFGLAHGYVLAIVAPIAVQLFTMIFAYSYRFILEGRNKEKIKQAMGKYISQDIMQNVVKNIDDIKLGGKKATVTVLFSDIRGFTRISEQLSAEEVSVILNEYFSEIEPIITKYNGVINKFIGDAVMAIFGEPIQDINHAKNAVLCANEMLKTVDRLRDKWLFEGKPRIDIGIGINTGEAFVGNIGSEKRMEYTVIGDTVNVASRIESYNKVYKTNFLISSSTYEQVSSIADVIKISEVQIRGKSKKMDIYEVLRLL